ncbi:MAG: hypothetical protein ACI841_002239 [Planctomycetota bacterium]|jgi:hypothetical protein
MEVLVHLKNRLVAIMIASLTLACSQGERAPESTASSCMRCHNGTVRNDYSGSGIEDPHPFGDASNMACTTCHGGNGAGEDKDDSHIPPPPEIGDSDNLEHNAQAYFNRLTLTGIDRFEDYEVDGITYTAIDYLQFINPGDLRVVQEERSCGECHSGHSDVVGMSLLATSAGVLSGATYSIGAENKVEASRDSHHDTAADMGFRAVSDPNFDELTARVGGVGELVEFPVYSARTDDSSTAIVNNDAYNAFDLSNDLEADGRVISDSNLARLFHEQTAFTCGDCHLGSAGANNRYGDFRSSGCTSCHMQYSLDGRSGSGDPNMNPMEPLDPDQIRAPERSHISRHLIRSVAKTLPSGEHVEGISDFACAGCHQGSNRTVMQYWGIRLDQNEDVHRRQQYPANPVTFVDTGEDPRLFDPEVENRTFNGRRDRQYLAFEDYDGDGRDDTPADVHHDAGMGCIDCHGSYDLHGGDVKNPESAEIMSRMEQSAAIRCESCHGSVGSYADTISGETYAGVTSALATDSKGNPLPHVVRESEGEYWLTSRLTGRRHYVTQTRDVVIDNGKTHPVKNRAIYTEKASYAMGRADGDPSTGIGPRQSGVADTGFAHGDNMTCASCHSSWSNSCIGCHLEGEYNLGNNFSNITGERIAFREAEAQFVYQSPVFFQLGVGSDGKISPIMANTDTFFRYEDKDRNRSEVFSFSDRNGGGNNTSRATRPSLAHNVMMPHSIRGRVDAANEGPRYCVSCHLTDEGLEAYGDEYTSLRTAMSTGDLSGLDTDMFTILKSHIGQNPGNQMNSPLWVHQVAGLGSGLFLFDENGCAVNPLDENDNRYGCDGVAPADSFDVDRATLNLDRIVDETGASTGSNAHPLSAEGAVAPGLRDGAANPELAGPMGATLLQRLTDPDLGIVLDSWFDADGEAGGRVESVLDD